MRALIIKEFRELYRDKRTLAMVVTIPLLLLVIFGYAANFSVDILTTKLIGPQTQQVSDMVAGHPDLKDTLDIVEIAPDETDQDARDTLRDGETDLVIFATTTPVGSGERLSIKVYSDGSHLFAAQSAQVLMSSFHAQMTAQASHGEEQIPPPELEMEILFNPDLSTAWVMVPALVGLILAFVAVVITSIGLVREQEAGTMEQLAVMPLSSSSIVMGKITPYFLLALIDMSLITLLGMALFGVPFEGDWTVFAVGSALFLFAVLGLGVFISSISKTTVQAVQLAIMSLLPQVLLSGMIFPLESMAAGVRWIGYALPLTWFIEVSRGVMLRGASWQALWPELTVLAAMAVVIFGASIVRLHGVISPKSTKRHRARSGSKTGDTR